MPILPCRKADCASAQLKPATPGGADLVIRRLIEGGRLDRLGRFGAAAAAVARPASFVEAEHQRRPHRDVGVLQAARDEAVGVG